MKIKLILIILCLNIIVCAEPIDNSLQEQRTWDDFAVGYLFQGEAKSQISNAGRIIDGSNFDLFPSGGWKNYSYLPTLSFMVGIPGKDANGTAYPWALRPSLDNPDTLVYWGPTVSESWVDRTTNSGNIFSNFAPLEGFNYSGVTAGTIYGDELDYVDNTNTDKLLATSTEPFSWAIDENGNFFWPGWLSPSGDFFSDQDVYLAFSDKDWINLEGDDTYMKQGYPTNIKVEMIGSSYQLEELEDVIIFRTKLTNESQYNYVNLYTGLYFDADVLWGSLSGSNSGIHTNDDDMLEFNEELDIVYIYDLDGQSGSASDSGYIGLMYIEDDQNRGLTGLRYFDWYVRPAVVQDESSSGCLAGNLNCPVADDMEAIQYALLSNNFNYPNELISDWEWRGFESGPNPKQTEYNDWYFHESPYTGSMDPNFDSIEAIYYSDEFNNGPAGIDVVTFMSSGPYNIDAGQTIELSFALVFGEDEYDLLANAQFIKNNPILNIEYSKPTTTRLNSNFPNPFNPITNISFFVPNYEFVSIKIYDLNGKLITTLAENYFNQGTYNLIWDATNIASGKYLVNMESKNYTNSQIITLIK